MKLFGNKEVLLRGLKENSQSSGMMEVIQQSISGGIQHLLKCKAFSTSFIFLVLCQDNLSWSGFQSLKPLGSILFPVSLQNTWPNVQCI